jgi:hypothetical protein
VSEEEKKAVAAVPKSSERIPDADYKAMVELYERGEASIAELSSRFGVSRQGIYYRFNKDKIVKGSKSSIVEVEKAVERFIDRRGDFIEETKMQGFKTLQQINLLARKIYTDEFKKSSSLKNAEDDIRTLGRLNKIIGENIMYSLKILDADQHIEERDLPVLTIEDLTDQEVLDHHKSTGAMDEDATLDDMLNESFEEDD